MADDLRRDPSERYTRALRHPRRRAILCLAVANDGKAVSPNGISGLLNMPLPSIAYHFKVLAEDGVLRLRFARPKRGTVENFYRPAPEALEHPIISRLLDDHGLGQR